MDSLLPFPWAIMANFCPPAIKHSCRRSVRSAHYWASKVKLNQSAVQPTVSPRSGRRFTGDFKETKTRGTRRTRVDVCGMTRRVISATMLGEVSQKSYTVGVIVAFVLEFFYFFIRA